MYVCDSTVFIFLANFTRKSKSACLFLTVHVHRVSVYTWKYVLEHMHTFLRLRVYYGMCFGSSCCVDGVYVLCKRIFSLCPVAKT